MDRSRRIQPCFRIYPEAISLRADNRFVPLLPGVALCLTSSVVANPPTDSNAAETHQSDRAEAALFIRHSVMALRVLVNVRTS